MGEMRDRMLRGELYISDDEDNEAEFTRTQELLVRSNSAASNAWEERNRGDLHAQPRLRQRAQLLRQRNSRPSPQSSASFQRVVSAV